jgi:hypothetical protein
MPQATVGAVPALNVTHRPALAGQLGSPGGVQSVFLIEQYTYSVVIPQPIFPDGVWKTWGLEDGPCWGRPGGGAEFASAAPEVTVDVVVVVVDLMIGMARSRLVVELPPPHPAATSISSIALTTYRRTARPYPDPALTPATCSSAALGNQGLSSRFTNAMH